MDTKRSEQVEAVNETRQLEMKKTQTVSHVPVCVGASHRLQVCGGGKPCIVTHELRDMTALKYCSHVGRRGRPSAVQPGDPIHPNCSRRIKWL